MQANRGKDIEGGYAQTTSYIWCEHHAISDILNHKNKFLLLLPIIQIGLRWRHLTVGLYMLV